MRILYLDTSSSFLYCGVVDDDKLIDKIALELKQDLSTETLYNIQLMFNKNNIDVHSIDKIMVVNGSVCVDIAFIDGVVLLNLSYSLALFIIDG